MDLLSCDWRLRENLTDAGDIVVTVLELGHTCIIPLAMRSVTDGYSFNIDLTNKI